MTPRPPLGLERWGKITVRGAGPYVASCYYRDITGKLRRMERQGRTKSTARVALENALHEMVAVNDDDLTRHSTLAVLAEAWWTAYATTNPAQGTLNRYNRVKRIIVDAIGELRVHEASVPRLDRYLNAVHDRNGHSEAKVQRVVLSHMLSLAVRHGAAARNTVADTKLPAPKKKRPKALDDDVVSRVLAALRAHDARPRTGGTLTLFAHLLISTGARPSEVLALQWEEDGQFAAGVDLEAGTVEISSTVIEKENGTPMLQPKPKTESGNRVLTLPQFGVAALLEARTESTSKFVVPNARGGLQSRRGIARAWRAALSGKALGNNDLVGISPMAFRKTVATIIARELGPEAAALQLGHHDDSITKTYYIERLKAGPSEARMLLARLADDLNDDD